MATITQAGRTLYAELIRAGFDEPWERSGDTMITLSLLARHAKTYRRLAEIQCGDGIHSGEWVNANWDWITKRDEQVENRLTALAATLPENVTMELQGDPRGYLVRLIVADDRQVTRTVGVN